MRGSDSSPPCPRPTMATSAAPTATPAAPTVTSLAATATYPASNASSAATMVSPVPRGRPRPHTGIHGLSDVHGLQLQCLWTSLRPSVSTFVSFSPALSFTVWELLPGLPGVHGLQFYRLWASPRPIMWTNPGTSGQPWHFWTTLALLDDPGTSGRPWHFWTTPGSRQPATCGSVLGQVSCRQPPASPKNCQYFLVHHRWNDLNFNIYL